MMKVPQQFRTYARVGIEDADVATSFSRGTLYAQSPPEQDWATCIIKVRLPVFLSEIEARLGLDLELDHEEHPVIDVDYQGGELVVRLGLVSREPLT